MSKVYAITNSIIYLLREEEKENKPLQINNQRKKKEIFSQRTKSEISDSQQ